MTLSPRYNREAHADVCLLLEGTFPYVRGGVSTWVKQLIEGMPDLRFSILFLGANKGDYEKPVYDLPDNVVHIELHYMFRESNDEKLKPHWWQRDSSKQKKFVQCNELHSSLVENDGVLDDQVAHDFTQLLTGKQAVTEAELLHSKAAWDIIREKYQEAPVGLDFNHFFWTVRSMHAPLFVLADIAANAPSADLYHSVSTGYAGFLGSMCKHLTGNPYMVTEHGIYTKERELDLAQVDWIPEEVDPFKVGVNDNMHYLRTVWIRFFKSLGQMSYTSAGQVFTLFEGNRQRQILDGCPVDKLTVIPNGVNVARFRNIRRSADAPVPPVLGLMGRIVPIKDIKSFIRAMRIIRASIPEAEGWLIGPEDEDPDYTAECKQLVASQDLSDSVKFLGFQQPEDILPKLGLSVLTSVSEGQPLVILEGYAAGLPAIVTDVGSCSELVHGATPEDRALGAAGAVVPIANPNLFAEAALKLLTNRVAWNSARDAGIQRVQTYYDEVDMIRRYHDVYLNEIGQLYRSSPLKAG